jgi:hypothetical protein
MIIDENKNRQHDIVVEGLRKDYPKLREHNMGAYSHVDIPGKNGTIFVSFLPYDTGTMRIRFIRKLKEKVYTIVPEVDVLKTIKKFLKE